MGVTCGHFCEWGGPGLDHIGHHVDREPRGVLDEEGEHEDKEERHGDDVVDEVDVEEAHRLPCQGARALYKYR